MKANIVALGEVATIIAGQSPPGNTYNEHGSGLPFFQGKADFGEMYPVVRKWCVAPKKTAEAGDILVSVRAPVGPANVVKVRCCIGRGLVAVRPDEDLILRDFAYWNIKCRQTELASKGQGSTFSAISKSDLKSLLIPLPPLDEQRRIADILNRAAKIERLRMQAQARMREFLPALFVKMFGDPATNPMGWPVCKLSELSTLGPQYGANARSAPFASGRPRYIRITDIDEFGTLSNEPVGVECEDLDRYTLIEGDMLFARSGATVGKSYLYRAEDGPCVFAGYLVRFRPDMNKIHPEILSAFTRTTTYLDWVESKRRTVAQPNINGREYSMLPVMVPPMNMQRRFASIAKEIRVTVKHIELAGRITATLKASLMSRLLEKVA